MTHSINNSSTVAVVIPCYKTKEYILDVIRGIGNEIATIYVVDDGCPENTGTFVRTACNDPRVKVLYNEKNLGVGGAVIAGYSEAIRDGVSIIVKIDGDNQMDASLIPRFIDPILNGSADYTKGNRFYNVEYLSTMPFLRLCGNSILSLLIKVMSGYWNSMDPTNGYTAIHVNALKFIQLDKIDKGYFFESDMLFRLNTIRAVVKDIPIQSKYGSEKSNLSIKRAIITFPLKILHNFIKRIFYTYFLRDFNAGTIQLCLALFFLFFGLIYGGWHWVQSFLTHTPSTSGTVMLAALPIIIGSQFLISFINYDIINTPKEPIQKLQ